MLNLEYTYSSLRLATYLKSFAQHYRKHNYYYPPSYVLWDCTRRCNLACRHCGASKESYADELSESEVKALVDQIAKMGCRFFAATGGEPLLREDMVRIMAYASEQGMGTGIATNGYLLDEKKAAELKQSGIKSIQISLDGTEEIHNFIRRNEQSYQNAIAAIRHCHNVGIYMVTTATVISKYNYDNIPILADRLAEVGVKHWKVMFAMPIGRAETDDCAISKTQMKQMLDFIKVNRKRFHIIVGENLPWLGKADSKIRQECTFCPVGITTCCIGVNGNIRGCPEMPDTDEFLEGNIRDQNLWEIWQKGFRKYRSAELRQTDTKCKSCSAWSKCRGGCWVMRLNGTHCIKDYI